MEQIAQSGRVKKINDEQRAEVARRYLAGETHAALASIFGVSKQTIKKICIAHKAVRPPKQAKGSNINEFVGRARSILWRQDPGREKPIYEKWVARVKELQAADGAGYTKAQSIVRASKEYPCLYRLFREYDLSSFDPNPDSHPQIKHYGIVNDMKEIHCENKEQSHRENLNWAIEAAGEFLRTGKMPLMCPNNSAWYLFEQARAEPKDFLSRFNQIESKSDDGAVQRQAKKSGQRSIAELELMIGELSSDEQRTDTEEALREVSESDVSAETAEEENEQGG